MIFENRDPSTTTVKEYRRLEIDVNPTAIFHNMYVNQEWRQVKNETLPIHEAVVDSIEQLDDHMDGADYFHVIVLAFKDDDVHMEVMNVQQGYVKSYALIETET